MGSWDEPIRRMTEVLSRLVANRSVNALMTVEMTLGEWLDRRAILEIKRDRMTDPEKLRNVRAELESLGAQDMPVRTHPAAVAQLARKLRTVNETLWDAEDAIRRCEAEGDFGNRFITLARSIYQTNDQRAALKRQINELLGCARQEEKHYSTG